MCIALGGDSTHAGTTKEQFLAEYELAARKLQTFYCAMTMEGTEATSRLAADNQTVTTVRDEFKLYTNGDRLRIDTIGTRRPDGEHSVLSTVVSPQGAFAVTREVGEDTSVLRDLNRSFDGPDKVLRNIHFALFAPYAGARGEPILKKLKDSSTTILEVKEEQRDGESFVTVSFQYPLPARGRIKVDREALGSYTFAKNRGWVVVEAERGPKGTEEDHLTAHVKYGDTVDGIPLLKKVEYWQQVRGKRIKMVEVDVSKIVPGAVADREFTLAAFGIRDIGEEKESSYWLYLIIAGVVLLAAAIVLARVTARKRARTNHMG